MWCSGANQYVSEQNEWTATIFLFLFDLPSDHEVDENLVTECEVIRTVLANRGFRSVVKATRISSMDRFKSEPWRPYPNIGYVHLAAHGRKRGIGLIDGRMRWTTLARRLRIIAPRLAKDQKRVLVLSCCYSSYGYEALQRPLRGHFTGCYYFEPNEIGFSDAMTTWAMFYKHKTIRRPHAAIVNRINSFFDEDILAFGSI
jgi:hypothetical protein